MGFLSKILGVSESKTKLHAPQLEPEAQEFQSELFPRIESGLEGGGLTPIIDEETKRTALRRTGEEFIGTRRNLESGINRSIPRADVGVRSFLRESLKRQFARQKEGINREFEFRGFEDKGIAQNMAFGAVGSERKIATDILNATNQTILRRALSPTFGSELAGGLGGAAGIALADRPGQGTPNTGATGFFQQFGSSGSGFSGTRGGAAGPSNNFGGPNSYKEGLVRQY